MELDGSIGLWFGRVDSLDDIDYELEVANKAITNAYHKACPE